MEEYRKNKRTIGSKSQNYKWRTMEIKDENKSYILGRENYEWKIKVKEENIMRYYMKIERKTINGKSTEKEENSDER